MPVLVSAVRRANAARGARAIALVALAPVVAHAHDGRPLEPHDAWTAWELDPWVVVPLALLAVLYTAGLRRLWTRAGTGRGITRGMAAAHVAGWVTLALALVSPIHAMGEVLFSAHMVQHELLVALAAPLLVLGRPGVVLAWGLPSRWRPRAGRLLASSPVRATWRFLTLPFVAFVLHAAALWLWHAPRLYERSLTSDLAHATQHASFLGTALLFWWSVLRPLHTRGEAARRARGAAAFSLFATMLHTGALGALLTFATSLWYPAYGATTAPWGLMPLEDQQLAGVVMWVPGGIAYLAATLALMAGLLREPSVRASRLAAAALLLVTASACARDDAEQYAIGITGGDPARGRAHIKQFGCGSCHAIPGVRGATATVGPPLAGIAGRAYIAGVLPNQPDNMMTWLMNPRAVDSLTAMPITGLDESQARDVAAYLYTLR